MTAISVLMPIYNALPYLEQSLESVRAQTFTDFEVICVNDGSTDGSQEVIDRFCAADSRFRSIAKPNSGYGATMNRALDQAAGEWIAVLEPDDFYEPDALATLIEAGLASDADLVKADFFFHWSNPPKDKRAGVTAGVLEDVRGTDGANGEMGAGGSADAGAVAFLPLDHPQAFFMMPSIWSGLYRASFLRDNDIRFLETPGASFQDLSFTFKAFAHARRVVLLDTPVLHYRQDNENSSINDPRKAYCVFPELAEIDARAAQIGDPRLAPIVFRMKHDNFLWNLGRLEPSAREDFFYAALGDLQDGVATGAYDPRLFRPYQRKNLEFLLAKPEEFLRIYPANPTRLQKARHFLRVGGLPLALETLGLTCGSKDQDAAAAAGLPASGAGVKPDAPAAEATDGDMQPNAFHAKPADGEPLLTVVVPVYNVQGYLDACLDSLEAQTLSDIEVICINDGSTDDSLDVLHRRAAANPRIHIVDKPNGGLSSARNAGIEAASAPFVCFLDADDTFTPNACATIVRTFQDTGADLVTFGANCVCDDPGMNLSWYEDVLSPADAVYAPFQPDLLFKERSRPFAWRTAARTAFLRGEGGREPLLFNENVKFGEDQVFHFAVYPRAAKTVLLSDKLHNYRITRAGGMMARIEADPDLKMTEHVAIARFIFDDWSRAGLFDAYAPQMMGWLVEFLLFDSLKLPAQQRTQKFAAAGELIERFAGSQVNAGTLSSLDLPRAEADIVVAAVQARDADGAAVLDDRKARALANAYYVHRYGKKSALRKVFGKLKR